MTDRDLIHDYLAGDAGALPALVQRYVHMVHAAARRQTPEYADDVVQAVFLLLSQKAATLRGRASLASWLFLTTRLCARHAMRSAQRRRFHEREAAMRGPVESVADHTLLALLDEAIAALSPADQELLLQRYLQNQSFEQVAEALQVNVPTVARRTQRAVERLRRWFASKGVTVPVATVTGLLLTEAAHQAPGLLAAGLTPALASSGASAIAQGAGAAMGAGVKMKVAVVVSSLVLAGAAATGIVAMAGGGERNVPAAASMPRAIPRAPGPPPPLAPPVDEAAVAGALRIVRFQAPLKARAAAELKTVVKPMVTESQLYEGYRGETAAVMEVLGRAAHAGEFLRTSQEHNVEFETVAQGMTPPVQFSTLAILEQGRSTSYIPFAQGIDASGSMELEENKVRLTARVRQARVSKGMGSIFFDGLIAPGETILYIADSTQFNIEEPLYHVVLWQVFKATDVQFGMMRYLDDSLRWITYGGPAGGRVVADRAELWRKGASKEPLPAKFSHKLENGVTVRLRGFSRPSQYPYCWWRPDGVVSGDLGVAASDEEGLFQGMNNANPYVAYGAALDVDGPVPLPPENDLPGVNYLHTYGGARIYRIMPNRGFWRMDEMAGELHVGVGIGAWEDVGRQEGVGTFRKGDISVRVNELTQGTQGRFSPYVEVQAPPEVELRLLAMDRSGKMLPRQYSLDDIPSRPSITFGRLSESEWHSYVVDVKGTFVVGEDVKASEFGHFLIQKRKREWVIFEGFAKEPAVPVPEVGR